MICEATYSLRRITFPILGWLMKFHIEPACFATLVQSSRTSSPYLEAESAYVQNMQGLSQLKCRSASNTCSTDMEKQNECAKLETESVMPESETGGILHYLISAFTFSQVFFFLMILWNICFVSWEDQL